MASTSKKAKVVKEKRDGKHGCYKKSLDFIDSNYARKIQENSYLNSMKRIVSEMSTKTRTPCIFLAYSDGNFIGSASTPSLQKILNSDIVKNEFLSSFSDGGNDGNDNEPLTYDQSASVSATAIDNSSDDLELPDDWKSLNAWEKRRLVCRLVYWTKKTENIKWKAEDKPVWWPSSIMFQSPHCKNKRATTDDLFCIIKSFLMYHGDDLLHSLSEDADTILSTLADKNVDDVVKFCSEKYMELYPFMEFVTTAADHIDFKKIDLSNIHMIPETTSRKPMKAMDCYARVVSLSLFNSLCKWKMIKILSIIYNVSHFDEIETLLQDGWLEWSGTTISEQTGISNGAVSLMRYISANVRSEKSDLLCLYGIQKFLKLKMDIAFDYSSAIPTFQYIKGESENRLEIISKEDNMAIPLVTVNMEVCNTVCGWNPFCQQVDSNCVFTCRFCRLVYHSSCVEKVTDDSCGCHLLHQFENENRLLQSRNILTEILSKKHESVVSYVDSIIKLRIGLHRCNLIKQSTPENKLLLENINLPFYSAVPENCRRMILSLADYLATSKSRVTIIRENFPNIESSYLVNELLFPEICKTIIRNFGAIRSLNDLTLERFIQCLAETD